MLPYCTWFGFGLGAVRLLLLLLLLAFLPAPHLLLTHLDEQSLLLVLVQGLQELRLDVHVLQDLLQHGGGLAAFVWESLKMCVRLCLRSVYVSPRVCASPRVCVCVFVCFCGSLFQGVPQENVERRVLSCGLRV